MSIKTKELKRTQSREFNEKIIEIITRYPNLNYLTIDNDDMIWVWERKEGIYRECGIWGSYHNKAERVNLTRIPVISDILHKDILYDLSYLHKTYTPYEMDIENIPVLEMSSIINEAECILEEFPLIQYVACDQENGIYGYGKPTPHGHSKNRYWSAYSVDLESKCFIDLTNWVEFSHLL